MMHVKLYSDGAARGNPDGPGGYGTILEYVDVNAFNQHWVDGWIKKGWKRGKNEPVKNEDLWKHLLAAKQPHKVTFHCIKGHDGHPQNERCDELATTAADGTDLIPDEVETEYLN